MEGEQDGAPQEAEEWQGQPTEPQERETPQAEQPDHKELLDRRDVRIAELKAQVAEAAKSKESADAIAAEIERARTDASEEKVAYELIRRPTPRGSPVVASERTSHSVSRGSPRRWTRAKSTKAVNRRLFMPRFRTARESPRHSLADRYLGPARQTARSLSAEPE